VVDKPKGVIAYESKGKMYCYYRSGNVKIAIPYDPTWSSAAFKRAYAAAKFTGTAAKGSTGTAAAPAPAPRQRGEVPETGPLMPVAKLVMHFKRSATYEKLKPTTLKNYNRDLDRIVQHIGDLPVTTVVGPTVVNQARGLHGSVDAKPWCGGKRATEHLLSVLNRLFTWAESNRVLLALPAEWRTPFAKVHTDGHKSKSYRPWRPQEIERFQKEATPSVYTASMLALYIAQRQSDVICIKWDQYDGEYIDLTPQKTENAWEFTPKIPVHPALKKYLDTLPCEEGKTIVQTEGGGMYTEDGFRTMVRKVLEAAGLLGIGLTWHGLRHTAGKRLAEAGATTEQIKALLLHKTDRAAAIYTKGADQVIRADAAMAKLIAHEEARDARAASRQRRDAK
jgi:integrase